MANFALRDVPSEVWARFVERAEAERWPLRVLVMQLMDDYGRHQIAPSVPPPPPRPRPPSTRHSGPMPTAPGDVVLENDRLEGITLWLVARRDQQHAEAEGPPVTRLTSWAQGLQMATNVVSQSGQGRIFTRNAQRLWREEPGPNL